MSYVVTGGGRGVGRAVVERLVADAGTVVVVERHAAFLADREPAEAEWIEAELARLHPVGRIGRTGEVAAAVAFLLSPQAGFVNGVTLPVDGGRAVLGLDPEAR